MSLAAVRPFTLNQPIVSSTTPGFSGSIQAALDRTAPGYGGDAPETDIEALYQLVTGLGFDGNNNGSVRDSGAAGLSSTQTAPGASGDVPDFASFTPDPASQVLAPSGSVGGGGFRAGACLSFSRPQIQVLHISPKGKRRSPALVAFLCGLCSDSGFPRNNSVLLRGGLQETVTA